MNFPATNGVEKDGCTWETRRMNHCALELSRCGSWYTNDNLYKSTPSNIIMANLKSTKFFNPRKTTNSCDIPSGRFLGFDFLATIPNACFAFAVIISLVFIAGAAQAQLTPPEIAALTAILDNFPALAHVPSDAKDHLGNYIGRAWRRDFLGLCEFSGGYKYFGIECADTHVAGLYMCASTNWNSKLSNLDILLTLQNCMHQQNR